MTIDEIVQYLEAEQSRIQSALLALRGTPASEKPRKTPKPSICKVCGKPGHNARSHKKRAAVVSESRPTRELRNSPRLQCLDCREDVFFPTKTELDAHRTQVHSYKRGMPA